MANIGMDLKEGCHFTFCVEHNIKIERRLLET